MLEDKFGIVTCLWNVLGHVPSDELRLNSLKNMSKFLSDDGHIFLDVNNRYNVKHYGILNVLRNIFKDVFYYKSPNGDFELKVMTKSGILQTTVHIFTPREIESLIRQSGLKVVKREIIDYKTGKKSRSILGGQLVYKLSKL